MLGRLMGRRRTHGRGPVLCVVAVLAVGVGGCGSGSGTDGDSGGPTASPAAPGTGDVMVEAREAVAIAYRGTYRSPDATPRPAARGRKVAIISAGQVSPTSAIPVAGAAEAAKALGWQVSVLDMQFNPANAAKLVKEATSGGADAIVANFDCLLASSELADAKARGSKIIPLYGFDCDDPSSGTGAGQPLFTTFINYGVAQVDAPKYTAGFGMLTANTIIAATNGTAKVISITDPAQTVLRYIQAGFLQQMGRCTGCKVLETVEFSASELGPALQDKVAAALARHPDATVIRTPFSAATHLGVAAAVAKSGRLGALQVFGGEGFQHDLDMMRTKQGLDSSLIVDSTWTGWAVIDSLNSVFVGEEPRVAGFGTMLVDREHNLPPSGPVRHNVDFKNVYRKAWGVA
jgi:ribose transport system substrate-binding protein